MSKSLYTLTAILIIAPLPVFGAGDPVAGEAAATKCISCHGKDGRGAGTTPGIAGQPAVEIAQSLLDYKTGKRSNPMMKMIAGGLSEQEIADLSVYYSALSSK